MAGRNRAGGAGRAAVRVRLAPRAPARRPRPLNTAAPAGAATTTATPDNVVTRWFGGAFSQLHPLLQDLHRRGGTLRGTIGLSTGRGIAAVFGRRLARRLGLPLQRERCAFVVTIVHEADALLWRRRFDDGAEMISRFMPYGAYPQGGWHEHTGPLQLDLGVDIADGGWHWRLRGARWRGLPLPASLLPRTEAGKRIVEGRYAFVVDFRLPLLGRVLRYEGVLGAETR